MVVIVKKKKPTLANPQAAKRTTGVKVTDGIKNENVQKTPSFVASEGDFFKKREQLLAGTGRTKEAIRGAEAQIGAQEARRRADKLQSEADRALAAAQAAELARDLQRQDILTGPNPLLSEQATQPLRTPTATNIAQPLGAAPTQGTGATQEPLIGVDETTSLGLGAVGGAGAIGTSQLLGVGAAASAPLLGAAGVSAGIVLISKEKRQNVKEAKANYKAAAGNIDFAINQLNAGTISAEEADEIFTNALITMYETESRLKQYVRTPIGRALSDAEDDIIPVSNYIKTYMPSKVREFRAAQLVPKQGAVTQTVNTQELTQQ